MDAEASANHLVIQRPASENLVVIFSGTGKGNGRFDFWKVAKSLDSNVILLNDDRNGWYQDGVRSLGGSIEETVNHLRAWGDRLGCKRVVTAGTSMGGYGAILFGTALDADILSFGVDTVLKRRHSRSEKMMPDDVAVRVPDLRPHIARSASRITCYVGEADALDMIGAAHISSLSQVKIHTLRGVDHAGARHIQRVSDLRRFMNSFANGAPLPKIRYQRKWGPGAKRLYLAYSALIERDWDEVDRMGRLVLRVSPHSEAAHYFIGRAALAQGRALEAVSHFSVALATAPHYEEAHLHLITALHKAKLSDQAISVAEEFISKWPGTARGHVYLSDAYWSARFEKASIRAMRTALSLETKEAWERKLQNRLSTQHNNGGET